MNNYKSYSELQEELGENYPFKLYEMGISALKEIENLQQELQRKNNNWNELKKWLKEQFDIYLGIDKLDDTRISCQLLKVLDKIKEIESK